MLFLLRIIIGPLALAVAYFIGLVLCLVRPFYTNNVHHTARMVNWVGRSILGIKYEITGAEYLKSAPAIIVSNHQNNFDMFPGSTVCPPHCVVLGKKELLWIPVFGIFFWLAGNIFINRENKNEAWESLEKVRRRIEKKKLSLWILPEGTRSRGRGLLPFKKGAFMTAIKAQVPLIPVCFSTYHRYFNFNKIVSGTIHISILPPLITQGLEKENEAELREHCHALMNAEIARLDQINSTHGH